MFPVIEEENISIAYLSVLAVSPIPDIDLYMEWLSRTATCQHSEEPNLKDALPKSIDSFKYESDVLVIEDTPQQLGGTTSRQSQNVESPPPRPVVPPQHLAPPDVPEISPTPPLLTSTARHDAAPSIDALNEQSLVDSKSSGVRYHANEPLDAGHTMHAVAFDPYYSAALNDYGTELAFDYLSSGDSTPVDAKIEKEKSVRFVDDVMGRYDAFEPQIPVDVCCSKQTSNTKPVSIDDTTAPFFCAEYDDNFRPGRPVSRERRKGQTIPWAEHPNAPETGRPTGSNNIAATPVPLPPSHIQTEVRRPRSVQVGPQPTPFSRGMVLQPAQSTHPVPALDVLTLGRLWNDYHDASLTELVVDEMVVNNAWRRDTVLGMVWKYKKMYVRCRRPIEEIAAGEKNIWEWVRRIESMDCLVVDFPGGR